MESAKRFKASPSEVASIMNEQGASSKSQEGLLPQDSKSGENVPDNTAHEPFLQELRRQVIGAANVECDHGIAINQLMPLCQALVDSNREIWDRCKPFCCKYLPLTEKCIFFRLSRLNVHSRTPKFPGDYEETELKIHVTPRVSKCVVEIPMCLPTRLGQLVVNPRPAKDDIMPDYDLFLRQSMLLIDDVVPMFLQEFKAFLERQQVALRKVDVWLFEGKENDDEIFTLQDQSGADITWDNGGFDKIDSRNSANEDDEGDEDYGDDYDQCTRCWDKFEDHDEDTDKGGVSCRTKHGKGCFRHPHGKRKEVFRCPFDGELDFTLTVETPEERLRLTKFLEFVGHDKTKPAKLPHVI